jgi:hypothetical protein
MDKNLIKAAMRLFFSDKKVGRTQKIYMRAFLATPRVVGRFHSHVFLLDRPSKNSADENKEESDEAASKDKEEEEEEDHEEDEEGGDDEPQEDAGDNEEVGDDGDDEFNPLALLGSVAEGMVLLTSIMEKHASKNPLWPCGLKPAKRLARAMFPTKKGNSRRVIAMRVLVREVSNLCAKV